MKTEARKRINKKQKEGDSSCHHVEEKTILFNKKNWYKKNKTCIEYFGGREAMTNLYRDNFIDVDSFDKEYGTGDSYELFYKHISEGRKYDLIDLDPYGLPWKFFPSIFKMLNDEGEMYVTSVKYHIPILNWRRKMEFLGRFGKEKPSIDDYISYVKSSALTCLFNTVDSDFVMLGKNTYRMYFKFSKISDKEQYSKFIEDNNNEVNLFNWSKLNEQ